MRRLLSALLTAPKSSLISDDFELLAKRDFACVSLLQCLSINQSINQSINLLMSCMGGDFPLAQQGKLRMGFCLSAYLVVGGGRLLNC